MQTEQVGLIRELIGVEAFRSVGDAELSEMFTRLATVIYEELDLKAHPDDQRILELFLKRRMPFSEVAAEMGVPASVVRRRWYRLCSGAVDRLTERLDSSLPIGSAFRRALAEPDFAKMTFFSLLAAARGVDPAELRILRRAIQTFGTHGDAVHWLLDECPALSGRPIDLAMNARGSIEIENVLGCIDHGIVF